MLLRETSVLMQFISSTSNSTGFEGSILPRALQSFAKIDSCEFLHILTKIVIEKTSATGNKFDLSTIYPLTLHPSTLQIFEFAINHLTNYKDDSADLKNVLCSLILVRHFEPINRASVVSAVVRVVNELIELLKSSGENTPKHLFALCTALQTLLYFKKEYLESKGFDEALFCRILLSNLKSDKSILALRCFNLFLTLSQNFICLNGVFTELYSTIEDWLLSPQSNSRLLALHSLQRLEASKEEDSEIVRILQNTLEAEFVPLTVTNYRDKIMLLEKLNFELIGSLNQEKHKVKQK